MYGYIDNHGVYYIRDHIKHKTPHMFKSRVKHKSYKLTGGPPFYNWRIEAARSLKTYGQESK